MRKPFIVVPEAMVTRMQEVCGASVDVLTSLPLPESDKEDVGEVADVSLVGPEEA